MTVLSITPKPKASDEVRAGVVRVLERALAEASEGNISSVLIIALHPGGEWSDWQSSTEQMSEMIGRIEIAKQKRIAHYFENDDRN